MKSYAEFIAYHRHYAEASPRIKDFVVGNSERILNRTTTDILYPCFWIEDPEITFEEDDDSGVYFDYAFVVLINAPKGDWQAEDYNLEQCFRIAKAYRDRLRKDAREGVFKIEGKITLDRIHTLTSDNDWGWRGNVRIRIEADDCEDDCCDGCADACPAGALAAFSFANAAPGNFASFSITNETQPIEHDWTYLWRWKIDAGEEQSFEGEVPEEIGVDGTWLYIRLTAAGPNGCLREATAFIKSTEPCGRSVPYIYNPARFYPGWADTALGWSDSDGFWTDKTS